MHSKQRVGSPSRRLVFSATILVVLAWVASVLALPLVVSMYALYAECDSPAGGEVDKSESCTSERMAAYGMFGDSFGAVNSLFSGLALAGIVLTLYLHSESSRRTAKPFIVPRMTKRDARVSIKEPKREGGIVHIPMEVIVPIQNSSNHAALNISLDLRLEGARSIGESIATMPLAAKDDAECELKLDIVGEEAEAFRSRVVDKGVVVTIRADYESVEGVSWYSQAKYLLTTNPQRPADKELLQRAVDGRMAEVSGWSEETVIDLEFSVVAGSWKFGEG